ncbi:MAG: hypothetical protein GY740_22180 [Gammaproteobacteria bacterium]|nr:hypothetical protein [Gammaproteobacteria bacterium]
MYPTADPGISDTVLHTPPYALHLDLLPLTPPQRQALLNVPVAVTTHDDLMLNLNQAPVSDLIQRYIAYFRRARLYTADDVQMYLTRRETYLKATIPKYAWWRCQRNLLRVLLLRPSQLQSQKTPLALPELSHGFKLIPIQNTTTNKFEVEYVPRPEVGEYNDLYLISHCWDDYWLEDDREDIQNANVILRMNPSTSTGGQKYAPSFHNLSVTQMGRPVASPSPPNLPIIPPLIPTQQTTSGASGVGHPSLPAGSGGPPSIAQHQSRVPASIGPVVGGSVTAGSAFPPPATNTITGGPPTVVLPPAPALPGQFQPPPPPPPGRPASPGGTPMDHTSAP